MFIQITAEQFNLIQNEIIELEKSLINIDDVWQKIEINDEIDILKSVLKSEKIEIKI